MKNWMKNIICSREWTENGSGMDRVWSRMTSIKPAYNHVIILTFLFLVLGGFNMNAWGDDDPMYTEGTISYSSGTWYVLNSATQHNYSVAFGGFTYTYYLAGPGSSFKCDISSSFWGTGDLVIDEYNGNTKLSNLYKKCPNNGGGWDNNQSFALSVNATKVVLSGSGASLDKYFRNVKVPMAPHIRIADESAHGTASISANLANTVYENTSAAYHIDLRSFLMEGTRINYVIENDDDDTEFHFGSSATTKYYDVLANSCAFAGGTADCSASNTALGDPDDYEADVYFTPATNKNGSSSATLYIKDGSAIRVTINLTAKVIPTYYFKATSVATDGTSTLNIPVRASFTSGVYSGATMTEGFPATADATSLTKTAYFYAPASPGDDYQFQGWYTNAACTSDRVSADNTISYDIISSGLTSGTAVEQKYYAKYLKSITAEFENTGSHDLDVGDTYEDISYSRTSSGTATDNDEDEENFFWYEIANNKPSGITTGSDHSDMIISYDPSTKVVTAHNAGTATLILHQRAHGLYEAVDAEYEFTVSKHVPDFDWNPDPAKTYFHNSKLYDIFTTDNDDTDYRFSSNDSASAIATKGTKDTLFIYNVKETATITVEQDENYYWSRRVERYDVTPVNPLNHVPFTYTEALYNDATVTVAKYTASGCGTTAWDDADKDTRHVRLGSGDAKKGDKYIILHIDGTPDKLTFSYKTSNASNVWFYVQESANNDFPSDNSGTKAWESTDNVHSAFSSLQTVQLQPTTRYLKFYYGGTENGRYKGISISELKTFEFDTDDDELDFGTKGARYGRQDATVNFKHINAGRITKAEIIGADASCFSVSPTDITGTGRDASGTRTLTVSFDNKDNVGREDADYTATLRVYDNNDNEIELPLTGHRWGKTTPECTWNAHHMPYYYNSTIADVASSTNTDYANYSLSYTTTDSDIAYVDENGDLHIGEKEGEVTITVLQSGGDYFEDLAFDTTFTPYAKPDLNLPFQLTSTIFSSRSVMPSSDQVVWDGTTDVRLGNNKGPGGYGEKSFLIAFGGTPDSITFSYKTSTTWSTQSLAMNAPQWRIEESPNGADGSWTTVWSTSDNRDSWATVTRALKSDTRYLNFVYDGNYYGYYGSINITALDGYKYLKTNDGKYLSRGGIWGTQAIVDEFGVPVRITRYTKDNTNDTTLIKFVDNKQYLFEETEGTYTGSVFTDTGVGVKSKWIQTVDGNKITLRRAIADGKYITVSDGKLAMTATEGSATAWTLETPAAHDLVIAANVEADVAVASIAKFGAEVNTKALMLSKISELDYTTYRITIPHKDDKAYEATGSRAAAGVPNVYDDTAEDLTPGLYRLTVQAFHQTAPDPTDWNNHESGFESVTAYLYANGVKVPLKSRYDESGKNNSEIAAGTSIEKNDKYYPANAAAAHKVFETESAYVNEIYVFVADAGEGTGTLNYGIEKPSYVPGEWLAYENFQLVRIDQKDYIYTSSGWTLDGVVVDAPTSIQSTVTIQNNVNISTEVKAYVVNIDEDVQVTIKPAGGLTVGAGGIVNLSDKKIKLESNTDGQTGFLRIDPEYAGTMPEVDVEMYSKAYHDNTQESGSKSKYQCVGVPISDEGVRAKTVYPAGTWIYTWNESTEGWTSCRTSMTFEAFKGFETTQKLAAAGTTYTYSGHIVSGHEVKTIDLDYSAEEKGYNLLANSFTAPIDIASFDVDDEDGEVDFVNAQQTIYFLNAGTKNQSASPGEGVDAPGKWVGVPIKTAEELAKDGLPRMIPSMQGFWVKATGANAQLKLDYSRLVWGIDYSGIRENKPLRARKQNAEEELPITGKLKISITAEEGNDYLFMLESERYDAAYEDGYDAYKIPSGGVDIFAVEGEDELGVDATNSIIGTKIGLRTGEEYEYTMKFSRVQTEDDLALLDKEEGKEIDIEEGTEYAFFATQNATITDRFEIIERSNAPAITTGNDGVSAEVKAQKFIKNNSLYIYKDGVLYNALGERVR